MRARSLSLLHWWMVTSLLFFVAYFLVFLSTGNYSHFGEAVSYSGWLRAVEGQPYLSKPNELPLALNCYAPLFLLPLTWLAKWSGIKALGFYSVLAKCYILALLASLLYSLRRGLENVSSETVSLPVFYLVSGFVVFHSPDVILSLRPDLLSYLFDVWAIFFFVKFLRFEKSSNLYWAAVFSGLAMSTKLNTLGASLAMGIWLLQRKKPKEILSYVGISASVFMAFIGVYYFLWGASTFENLFASVQSAILPLPRALSVYRQVLELLILPLMPFLFLVLAGLGDWRVQGGVKAKLAAFFSWVLLLQFILATLGQLKWGAFFNYYFGMLFVGILPAVHGFESIRKQCPFGVSQSVRVLCVFTLCLFLVRNIYTPLQILHEKKPYTRLSQYLEQQAPSGAIYTPSHNLSVHLHNRVMLGAVSEELLSTTPRLWRHYAELTRKLSQISFGAAVVEDPACNQWRPPKAYGNSLASLTRLGLEAEGVCVFLPVLP